MLLLFLNRHNCEEIMIQMLCAYCFLVSPIESSHVALLQMTGFNSLVELNLLSIFLESSYTLDLEGGGISKNKNAIELYILLGFYIIAENQCGQGRVDKDFEGLYCWNRNFQAKMGLGNHSVYGGM